MKEAGIPSAAELARRATARNRPISETGIKSILQGNTTDPQVSTVAAICAALDISPLRFVAEIWGIDPDDPGLKADDFRVLWEAYKDLPPAQQPKALSRVADLLLIMKSLKTQPR
jgi:hypothetical protein